MKKLIIITVIIVFGVSVIFKVYNMKNTPLDTSKTSEILDTSTQERKVTKDMAYEGVYNYCHSNYDWSIAEDNPSIMYLEMDNDTETEYKLAFHSYTGAIVYFYVDKLNGNTRLVEYVPTLNIENEVGIIELFDYLNNNK